MKPTTDSVRVNVILPAALVEDLRRCVPQRRRSAFVAEAVGRAMRQLLLEKALEESAGAWSDADHPELSDGPSIDRWIAKNRRDLGWDRETPE